MVSSPNPLLIPRSEVVANIPLWVVSPFREEALGGVKFGLSPVTFQYSDSIPKHEINKIKKQVMKHEAFFLEKWQEFFGDF